MQMFQSCSCVWFLHSVVPHALSPSSCCWIGALVKTTWSLLSIGLKVTGLIYHDEKHKNGHIVVSFTLLTLSLRHWLLFLLGDKPRASAHCHMCTFLSKDWGHKGKYWTDICLPLRIFLQVRLYRFNLLCFVTNNTDLLPSLIWKTIFMKCRRKRNIRRLFFFFRWNRRLKYLHESVTE